MNGQGVGDDVFAPMPSLYIKRIYMRIYYNVYDVTDLLRNGANTIGVILGNGCFLPMRNSGIKGFGLPRLLAHMELEIGDGSAESVVSDTSWKKTSKGPIVANNEFDGEGCDARLELRGWNENGYNDNAWKKVDVMQSPGGFLTAQVLDIYTSVSDAPFVWQPKFLYHGFSFEEISGLDYRPGLSDFVGCVICDKM